MKSLNVQKLQCWHVKGLKENLNSVAAARIEAFTWNSQALLQQFTTSCVDLCRSLLVYINYLSTSMHCDT